MAQLIRIAVAFLCIALLLPNVPGYGQSGGEPDSQGRVIVDFMGTPLLTGNEYNRIIGNAVDSLSSQGRHPVLKDWVDSVEMLWMTSTQDEHRLYVKDCYIEGAVDYFYGGGDALLENCTLYNVRDASVIVAPCHTSPRFGYVFLNCIIDGNAEAAKGNVKLGRPWHNSPRAVYLHTTMRIPIAEEGWTNMGAIPALFAEYDSRDAEGNILDLSHRKTEYEGRGDNPAKGSCPATVSAEDAKRYTYENIIMADDGWNPRAYMTEPSK